MAPGYDREDVRSEVAPGFLFRGYVASFVSRVFCRSVLTARFVVVLFRAVRTVPFVASFFVIIFASAFWRLVFPFSCVMLSYVGFHRRFFLSLFLYFVFARFSQPLLFPFVPE